MRTYSLTLNDKDYEVTVKEFSRASAEIEVNGESYQVAVNDIRSGNHTVTKITDAPKLRLMPGASQFPEQPEHPEMMITNGAVRAPIPGAIMEVFVKAGDKVTAGQAVLKMEAMKMENQISAPTSGTITSVLVGTGDTVTQGEELLTIAD